MRFLRFSEAYRITLLCLWFSPFIYCSALNKDWHLLKKTFRFFQQRLLQRSLEQAKPNYGILFECRSESNPYLGSEVHFNLQLGDLRGYQLLSPYKNLALFLHGWRDKGNKAWVQNLLRRWTYFSSNYHVCVVDWSNLSQRDYKTASRSIFDVGITVASIIKSLEEVQPQFRRRQIIIAGYSLGAHAAGYAGYLLNGELEQIIGLDPAGPLFTWPAIVSPKYRLDKHDARYVQVLHTSGGTLGTHLKCGHADFYANSGRPIQPNCREALTDSQEKLTKYSDSEILETIICSHSTAAVFFKKSMDPFYPFIGYQCDNYMNFTNGVCRKNHRALFGIHSQRQSHGNFYFNTFATPPYVPLMLPVIGPINQFIPFPYH